MNTPVPLLSQERLSQELFHVRHQALLRAILDNISEGVSIMDASGQFVYTSPFARKAYGSEESDNTAQPGEWTQRFGIFRSDRQTPFPVEELPVWRALKGEEVRDVEMFIRNERVPDGVQLRCSCFPVRGDQGELLGVMTLTQDIDKQFKLEAEKRRTQHQFRLLVETAQEGIWTIDTEWRTEYVNRYMANLLGYRPEEMVGMHLFSFLDEEGQQSARRRLERRGEAPKADVLDFKFLRKDGTTLWTSISTTPRFDEQGRYVGSLAMITDITQRRKAEQEVRQLNAELEQRIAERTAQLEFSNRELESFASSVAHDLRAPLRGIASFSDALLEDCAGQLDEQGQDYLRRIVGGVRRMADLIDGILALSRVNSRELATHECNLSDMAASVVEQLRSLQPERDVRVNIQEGLMDQGDPQLLRVVLENLLGNAWKFTRGRPVGEIEFTASQDERGVRTYQVHDNGAGFDMTYLAKLFGVFQRLHTQLEFEGNGVGLATVQRIVRRHGGRVWGEGQPDSGASFFFTLNEFPRPPRTTAEASERGGHE